MSKAAKNKIYKKTHKDAKALANHKSKIKARHGHIVSEKKGKSGTVIEYTFLSEKEIRNNA